MHDCLYWMVGWHSPFPVPMHSPTAWKWKPHSYS
jgi:hypothetical protein